MKALTVLIFAVFPLCSNAQNDKGVKFLTGLTWDQVLSMASAQDKHVFVDCYATWCVPCKEMDVDVYPEEKIGAIVNSKFISIKVQVDSNAQDTDDTKLLYSAARLFENKYQIKGLPTYLFFSPQGKLVHRGLGKKTIREFSELVSDALNPSKQLYALLEEFYSDRMPLERMPYLADRFKEVGEDKIAYDVARRYMLYHLDKLSEQHFWTAENLNFLHNYRKMVSSRDKMFTRYGSQSEKVDAIMNVKGYSNRQILSIIEREEIEPELKQSTVKSSSPNWNKLFRRIAKKYSQDLAFRLINEAQGKWFFQRKEWKQWTESIIRKWQRIGGEFSQYGWMYLNHIAWTVCVHSNQKSQLEIALKWVELGMRDLEKPELAIMDTKAHILYKLGRADEALPIIDQIITLNQIALNSTSDPSDKINLPQNIAWYRDIRTKMQNRQEIELYD